jgi:hypothetical protein
MGALTASRSSNQEWLTDIEVRREAIVQTL